MSISDIIPTARNLLGLTDDDCDPMYDHFFTSDDIKDLTEIRHNEICLLPGKGVIRIALKPFRRLDSDYSKIWCYHGTHVKDVKSIVDHGLLVRGGGRATKTNTLAAFGEGVYITPDISLAVQYGELVPFVIGNKNRSFYVVLDVRVGKDAFQKKGNLTGGEVWLSRVRESARLQVAAVLLIPDPLPANSSLLKIRKLFKEQQRMAEEAQRKVQEVQQELALEKSRNEMARNSVAESKRTKRDLERTKQALEWQKKELAREKKRNAQVEVSEKAKLEIERTKRALDQERWRASRAEAERRKLEQDVSDVKRQCADLTSVTISVVNAQKRAKEAEKNAEREKRRAAEAEKKRIAAELAIKEAKKKCEELEEAKRLAALRERELEEQRQRTLVAEKESQKLAKQKKQAEKVCGKLAKQHGRLAKWRQDVSRAKMSLEKEQNRSKAAEKERLQLEKSKKKTNQALIREKRRAQQLEKSKKKIKSELRDLKAKVEERPKDLEKSKKLNSVLQSRLHQKESVLEGVQTKLGEKELEMKRRDQKERDLRKQTEELKKQLEEMQKQLEEQKRKAAKDSNEKSKADDPSIQSVENNNEKSIPAEANTRSSRKARSPKKPRKRKQRKRQAPSHSKSPKNKKTPCDFLSTAAIPAEANTRSSKSFPGSRKQRKRQAPSHSKSPKNKETRCDFLSTAAECEIPLPAIFMTTRVSQVRAGYSKKSKQVGAVPANVCVRVTEVRGNRARILELGPKFSNSGSSPLRGWVSIRTQNGILLSYLKSESKNEISKNDAIDFHGNWWNVQLPATFMTSRKAQVRQDHSLQSMPVGQIEECRCVTVIEIRGNRARISSPIYGWATIRNKNGNILSHLQTDFPHEHKPIIDVVEKASNVRKMKVLDDSDGGTIFGLGIYAESDTKSQRVRFIDSGETFTVVEVKGGWVRLETGGWLPISGKDAAKREDGSSFFVDVDDFTANSNRPFSPTLGLNSTKPTTFPEYSRGLPSKQASSPISQQWSCPKCTLNNCGFLDHCELCGAQKPPEVRPFPGYQPIIRQDSRSDRSSSRMREDFSSSSFPALVEDNEDDDTEFPEPASMCAVPVTYGCWGNSV